MMSRPALVAAAAAVLSPATGAGLQLAVDCAVIWPLLTADLWTRWGVGVVSGFFFLGALPAAVLSAIGYLTFVLYRAKGFSVRALLIGAAVLGAACCLFVAGLANPRLVWWSALLAMLNGALWGVLIGYSGSRDPAIDRAR